MRHSLETNPADDGIAPGEAEDHHDAETDAAEGRDDAPTEGDEEPDEADAEAPAEGEEAAERKPRKRRLGAGADLDDEELFGELSALLFASPEPLSLDRLVELLQRPPRDRVREALAGLAERLAEAGLPIVLKEIAGGFRLFTAPHQHETVQRLSKAKRSEKVSPAALETLSIVAYKQPVTKAEIEAIRGVQAGPALRGLVDRGLVKVTGRADQPGSPLQYGTTREFLDRFGLASLSELPRDAELVRD